MFVVRFTIGEELSYVLQMQYLHYSSANSEVNAI